VNDTTAHGPSTPLDPQWEGPLLSYPHVLVLVPKPFQCSWIGGVGDGERPWDDASLTIEADRVDGAFVTHEFAADLGR
jgi:hypothetical protein